MTTNTEHVQYVYTEKGRLTGVLLSAEAWDCVGAIVEKSLGLNRKEETVRPEPMEDWQALKDYWDFKYPVCADVVCGHCGAASDNWEDDSPRKFWLKAANIGGLVSFECLHCHSRVTKRHFKDCMKFECTPVCECK